MATPHSSPSATPPNCRSCNQLTTLFITRVSNRKGNARRPYYKCSHCAQFQRFNDQRGNSLNNPPCHCNVPSKMQVSGPDKIVSRGLHYVCQPGACDYYEIRRDGRHRQVSLPDDDVVNMFASLQLI
jgi:hypothetical protein